MCIAISCVVGRARLLLAVHSLGKALLALALLHFVLQGQTCLLLQVSLDFLLLQNGLCLLQGKPFNITVIQVYAPTTNAKGAGVEF